MRRRFSLWWPQSVLGAVTFPAVLLGSFMFQTGLTDFSGVHWTSQRWAQLLGTYAVLLAARVLSLTLIGKLDLRWANSTPSPSSDGEVPPVAARARPTRRKLRAAISWITVALVVGMSLYPPWLGTYQRPGISAITSPIGYALLFKPPRAPRPRYEGIRLDFQRLALQYVSVLTVAAGLLLTTRKDSGTQ